MTAWVRSGRACVVGSAVSACTVGSALGSPTENDVFIDLSGITIQNNASIARDSDTDALDGTRECLPAADGYELDLDGNVTVRFIIPLVTDEPFRNLLQQFIEPGQDQLLNIFVRNPGGALPASEGTVWTETFAGEFFGINITITLEYTLMPDGLVTFRVRDVDAPLGLQIEFEDGGFGRASVWTPSSPRLTEWHFDGGFTPADGSAGAGLRYLDDPAFGAILAGTGAKEDRFLLPLSPTPTGVTQAQSSFIDTALDPGIPAPGGVDTMVYMTSPSANAADPGNQDWRRGIGLAMAPFTRPAYPGHTVGQWSMVWDLYIPEESYYSDFPANAEPRDRVAALIEQNHNNRTGADVWLVTNGGQPGVVFSFEGTDITTDFVPLAITPGQWFRLALVADESRDGRSSVYLDGAFAGETGSDYLFNSLDPTTPSYSDDEPIAPTDWTAWGDFPSPWSLSAPAEGDPAPIAGTVCLFSDLETGASQSVCVANMLWVDDLLTAAELLALGGPSGDGIVLTGTVCFADCDGNGMLNVDDIDCFVAAFLGGDLGLADCDGNTMLNVDDIDCFVASFLGGCP